MNKEKITHVWHEGDQTITFTWLGDVEVKVDRVFALAFTPDEQMLLVSDGGTRYWLPGGGLEPSETPKAALSRELYEEAAASLLTCRKLGVQRADSLSEDGERQSSYQAFYGCRVTLEEAFVPQHEIIERRLVAQDAFLDTLFWGRRDPKGALLLKLARDFSGVRSV